MKNNRQGEVILYRTDNRRAAEAIATDAEDIAELERAERMG